MSGHKLGGPKGVGSLFCREVPGSLVRSPAVAKKSLRSGTENVPGAGFGRAVALAMENMEARTAKLRQLQGIFLAD